MLATGNLKFKFGILFWNRYSIAFGNRDGTISKKAIYDYFAIMRDLIINKMNG